MDAETELARAKAWAAMVERTNVLQAIVEGLSAEIDVLREMLPAERGQEYRTRLAARLRDVNARADRLERNERYRSLLEDAPKTKH